MSARSKSSPSLKSQLCPLKSLQLGPTAALSAAASPRASAIDGGTPYRARPASDRRGSTVARLSRRRSSQSSSVGVLRTRLSAAHESSSADCGELAVTTDQQERYP